MESGWGPDTHTTMETARCTGIPLYCKLNPNAGLGKDQPPPLSLNIPLQISTSFTVRANRGERKPTGI